MKFRDRVAALNRLQKTTSFKVIATIIVLALGIGAGVTYTVRKAAAPDPLAYIQPLAEIPAIPEGTKLTPAEQQQYDMAVAERNAAETNMRAVRDILNRQADPTSAITTIAIVCGIALCVVWIGQGLTGMLLLVLLTIVCLPLYFAGQSLNKSASITTRAWGARLHGTSLFLSSIGVLAFGFIALMDVLRAVFGGPYAVTAIARNVVNEAIRMKVSLVFIVLLIFMLAALPGMLDPDIALRYRVQSFLQYSTGGTFWIVAILVLFLAVGSVAFEQRDKIIWQTMTKPVAPWQYLLGKWLGVVGVAAVLLTVSSAGSFMFVEYLRGQKAMEESAPYVAEKEAITPDRLMLETQVLTARLSKRPDPQVFTKETDEQEIKDRKSRVQQADGNWADTKENEDALRDAMYKERLAAYLTIEPGARERYVFSGLKDVKARNIPFTIRFRPDFGSNDPRHTYSVSFLAPNTYPIVQQIPGGQTMTAPIPAVAINDNGELELIAINGDVLRYLQNPQDPSWVNDMSMSFPPDGLEVNYSVGSYRGNFARVMFCLWLKLAFLAMVAVWAGTFLSFSVASLVAFGIFLMAESAAFLSTSLEYFSTVNAQGAVSIWRTVVHWIAAPIAGTFKFYADMKPTAALVDGKLISWVAVVKSVLILGALVSVLYAMAVGIFRNRELATYSGQ